MGVTTEPAIIANTQVFVHATRNPKSRKDVHVCGYQNTAITQVPNCMFLHFPGTELAIVEGPKNLPGTMYSIARDLLPVAPPAPGTTTPAKFAALETYGPDYYVVLAQQPGDILSQLETVPAGRRPARTRRLEQLVDFYASHFPKDSFALACFSGQTTPTHPIMVEYVPHDPEVLTAPGLTAHDGELPILGAPVARNFQVAFAVQGIDAGYKMDYLMKLPGLRSMWWAPAWAVGFNDNRAEGPNTDYRVALDDVINARNSKELLARTV